jgi:hypothetical protein
MAILHRATVTPSKRDLVEMWLDEQPWGGSGEIEMIGSYRFDDPEGAVGVEALLVLRSGRQLHVPMTYRGAPLGGAKRHLMGTMDHSVLGTRWIYEAAGDPVAMACFTRALAGQQDQATLELYEGDELIAHPEPTVRIHRQSGSAAAPGNLRLAQVLGDKLDGVERLVATWSDGEAVVAVR